LKNAAAPPKIFGVHGFMQQAHGIRRLIFDVSNGSFSCQSHPDAMCNKKGGKSIGQGEVYKTAFCPVKNFPPQCCKKPGPRRAERGARASPCQSGEKEVFYYI